MTPTIGFFIAISIQQPTFGHVIDTALEYNDPVQAGKEGYYLIPSTSELFLTVHRAKVLGLDMSTIKVFPRREHKDSQAIVWDLQD